MNLEENIKKILIKIIWSIIVNVYYLTRYIKINYFLYLSHISLSTLRAFPPIITLANRAFDHDIAV